MASETYGDAVYGLRDLKVTNIGGTTQEDLGAASMFEVVPIIQHGRLEGDDGIESAVSFFLGAEGSIKNGRYSSAAVAIMTGVALTQGGTSPNEITTLKINKGTAAPFFKVYGKAVDDGAGDLHILCSKVKLVEFNASKIEFGQWRVTEAKVLVLDDGTNGIFKAIQNETAANLPTS